MQRFKVVMTSQLYPSVEIERAMLEEVGADLEVADGEREDVVARAGRRRPPHPLRRIDAEMIGRLERCKVIARYGIGVDSIDLDAEPPGSW